MSFSKFLFIGSIALFSGIGVAALVKKSTRKSTPAPKQEIVLQTPVVSVPLKADDDFPQIDRVFQLFNTSGTRLPIVETITYESSVPWLKGRPAWISDYAVHYATSRHFIARSLNHKPDYFNQKVTPASRFNVFRTDKKIQFWLLVDTTRCKMGFYYVDLETGERVLLKTYQVGLGKKDGQKPSGCLTPSGHFTVGDKIAVYTPGTKGLFQDKQVEMIEVFGTRWLPLIEANGSAKSYGIQGVPLTHKGSELIEHLETLGQYESDGCIRMATKDIEELFSIVITKPTFVEIVRDFHTAKLPGNEVATPTR